MLYSNTIKNADLEKLHIESELLQRLAAAKKAEYEAMKDELSRQGFRGKKRKMDGSLAATGGTWSGGDGGDGGSGAGSGSSGKIQITYDEDGRSQQVE